MTGEGIFVFQENPLDFLENKNALRTKDAQLAEMKLSNRCMAH